MCPSPRRFRGAAGHDPAAPLSAALRQGGGEQRRPEAEALLGSAQRGPGPSGPRLLAAA